METVGDLNGLRCSAGSAVSINSTPVTADYFCTRMQLQPSSQAVCGTIRQQINRGVCLEIDQDGPITLTFPPSPIVNTNSPRPAGLYGWARLQPPKNGIGAGYHTEPLR